MKKDYKSGFVTLIGRPNVGKSTLMNQLIGQKIAITSNKPQTTRNRIQTVLTTDDGQIVFVDTPGIFASIIRRVIKQKYIHVAIGLDENLDEAYSIGRRHPSIPLIAGFEKEEKRKILRAFPGADYMICSIPCTQEQKQFIKEELHEAMKNRYRYHYTILGLPFLLFGKQFYQKNHYTCSSYAAELLEKAGVCTWNKHFSLVTPKDFYEYKGKQKIFEGSLRELTEREKKTYPEYGTLTFPPISRPAYLSAAGNYITMAHVHNVREEERKGRRRRYER